MKPQCGSTGSARAHTYTHTHSRSARTHTHGACYGLTELIMAEGGDAEDEIQFLRTVRLCFSVRICVCETIIRENLVETRHVVCRATRRAAPRRVQMMLARLLPYNAVAFSQRCARLS